MTATQPDTMFAPAERADRILLDQQAAYFQGNILLASLLDSVPNAFVVLNQQRQIVYTNRALVRWAGVEAPETLMGLRPGEALNCLHAHQDTGGCGTTEFCRTCGAVQAILTSLAGKETVQECRITRTDGTSVDLRASATPFNWKNDVFSLFAIQDISHEKRRQALEHIFFHDILNTAGALIGFADLLRDDRATQLHEIDLKGMVFDLSQQVVDQIQGQRELADAERGDLVPTWIRLDPVDVLAHVGSTYSGSMVAEDRHIVVAPESYAPPLVSDRILLERVIGNMIKNALEACDPGDAVTLSCRAEGPQVTFSVHNPSFMPRYAQLQVFQRSFSTKGTGRGLGTYSIRLLTEQYLGGSVRFTTSPESGTTFYATFPLEPEPTNQ